MKIARPDGLNIVPFIDIMLVLLAIVLSISTFIAQGKIAIDLPEANAAKPMQNEKKLVVLIDADNKIYINDKLVDDKELENALNAISAQTLVELRSDKQSRFESFVKVVDILKAKEHENFAISTELR